jgi:hypothetical protein
MTQEMLMMVKKKTARTHTNNHTLLIVLSSFGFFNVCCQISLETNYSPCKTKCSHPEGARTVSRKKCVTSFKWRCDDLLKRTPRNVDNLILRTGQNTFSSYIKNSNMLAYSLDLWCCIV